MRPFRGFWHIRRHHELYRLTYRYSCPPLQLIPCFLRLLREQDNTPKTGSERCRSKQSRGNNFQSITKAFAHKLLILIRSFAHCRLACVLGQEVDRALQYCIHGQICASGILCVGQEILEVCKKLLGLPKKIRSASSPHLHALVRPK